MNGDIFKWKTNENSLYQNGELILELSDSTSTDFVYFYHDTTSDPNVVKIQPVKVGVQNSTFGYVDYDSNNAQIHFVRTTDSTSEFLEEETIVIDPMSGNISITGGLYVSGNQVVSARQSAISDSTTEVIVDPADAPIDADALRDDLVTNALANIRNNINDISNKINQILQVLRLHGLIDS